MRNGLNCCLASALLAFCCSAARADTLAAALAPHVGQPIDLVELGTGKRFVRPTLDGVTERGGKATALRLTPEGASKTLSVPLSGIAKIIAGRETIHESAGQGKSAAQLRGKKVREQREQDMLVATDRMQKNGVSPWPRLSAAEHAAQVKELDAFVAAARQAFPALAVSHTHEFIVATDIPAAQMAPYLATLDAMHDFLCDLYGIPRGEPVWLGKCLVVAFLKEEDFLAFEGRFMGLAPQGVHGLCHQRSDGRVVMACHRGDDAGTFAHMLVHETSHGFNHRWLSPARLPNWLNEGIAEWVGTQVVPACRQVPLKEAKAVEFMQSTGSVGPGFFDDGPDAHINPLQYGIASRLVKFMVARDRKQFAAFVQGVKEGQSVEQSLKNSYRASLDDLVKAYGKALGVPNLGR
jgi:hypothetical protein